jgi:hypothetical protein
LLKVHYIQVWIYENEMYDKLKREKISLQKTLQHW